VGVVGPAVAGTTLAVKMTVWSVVEALTAGEGAGEVNVTVVAVLFTVTEMGLDVSACRTLLADGLKAAVMECEPAVANVSRQVGIDPEAATVRLEQFGIAFALPPDIESR
jgi:hypothetical protein